MSSDPQLRIRLFAQAREILNAPEVCLESGSVRTVADLRTELASHYPEFAALLQHSAVAVNRAYQPDHAEIVPGDEIAIIPPVAGG